MNILELLKPILEIGVHIDVYYTNGNLRVDLNTGAKSHCWLEGRDGEWKAYRRYAQIDEFETLEDIIDLVYECEYRRDFFNGDWCSVFDEYDYIKFDWRK